MGNSADRAWQLSQLVEGVSTAFNPSHGSLSCVKTNCVSFASAQARKRKIRSLLRRGRRARRARFPTCGVVRVAGYSVVWDCDPTPHISLKSTKRSAAAISRSQRSFITFYGALRIILLSAGVPVTIHMIALEQAFVNGSLQRISLAASESNRSVIYISFLRWIFRRWKIQFRKKRIAIFSHSPIRPTPRPHLQTNPDYCFSRAE